MPFLPEPDYNPPFPFTSGHIQTVYPSLFRPTPRTSPIRERIETDDGDFLDLDWHFASPGPGTGLAVISHGLEGDSRRKNVLGMAGILRDNGWDIVCLNFRGCSGVPNRLPRLYHSGVTDDLHRVLLHGLDKGPYTTGVLIGFSMGGNQTLKYLGEDPARVPKQVKAAVTFSVPCELADSVAAMNKWSNRLYTEIFIRSLREKLLVKGQMFPGKFDLQGMERITTFTAFDDRYTGPLHGFRDAADYYSQSSSRQFLSSIAIPTLLVQAADDPFLCGNCYPVSEAQANPNVFLEIPRFGGHVGFVRFFCRSHYWMEERALHFLQDRIPAAR